MRAPMEPTVVHYQPKMAVTSSNPEEAKECSIAVVSRGPRPPPDGRENPAAHQEGPPSLADRFPPESDKLKLPPPKPLTRPSTQPAPPDVVLCETKPTRKTEHVTRSLSYESPTAVARTIAKTYGRGKDTKSEGSVRDKIAMFSVHKTAPADPPAYSNSPQSTKKPFVPNRIEDVRPQLLTTNRMGFKRADYISKSYDDLLDCPDSPDDGYVKVQKVESLDWSVNNFAPPVRTAAPPPSYVDFDKLDYKISDENLNPAKPSRTITEPKASPIDLLNRRLAMADKITKTDPLGNESHRSTIDYLIEQRRKSMTKLRGLVIPDSQCVSNLPEIKSRDSLKMLSTPTNETRNKTHSRSADMNKPPPVPSSLHTLWDGQSILNNVPKYSPAFKRKSLQVYGPKSSTTLISSAIPKYSDSIFNDDVFKMPSKKNSAPSKPPRTSLDTKRSFDHREVLQKVQTLPSSFRSAPVPNASNIDQISKAKRSESFLGVDAPDGSNIKPKMFPEADSDNDSAVSSTQSSYLSTVSSPTPSLNTMDNTESDCSGQSILTRELVKRSSQYKSGECKNDESTFENGFGSLTLDDRKRSVCRSLSSDTSTSVGSSNSSTLTSGSQASCSSAGSTDTGSHRVLKPRSIEAINRKNILASAKCRSGKDKKFGSPLIERKFSDDSNVESTDEGDGKNLEPPIVPKSQHMEKIKFPTARTRAQRADIIPPGTVLKVAYSTLVVDDLCPSNNNKEETDSTYSDTASESDGEVVLKPDPNQNKTKKYTNGALPAERSKPNDAFVRRDNNFAKTQPETKVISKRLIENESIAVSKVNSAPVDTLPRLVGASLNGKSGVIAVEVNGKVKKDRESCRSDDQAAVQEQEQGTTSCVRLLRGAAGGVGVTLAGGADCEAKQVTIHKVLQGSAAERDGRLCKGDEVISINGLSMRGVTHAQSLAILKDPLPEVTIVVRGHRPTAQVSSDVKSDLQGSNKEDTNALISVELQKADAPGGAGLGISLQGGGNRPLLINKLFTGGAAARSGCIVSGSELLAAGDARLVGLTRTEAWGLLRALPAGPVTLLLRLP